MTHSRYVFTRLSIALTNLYGRQVSSSRANCPYSFFFFFFFIQRTLAANVDHTRRGKCVVSSLYFERKYYRNAARASAPANTLYLRASTTRSLVSPARNNIWPRAIARVAVKIAMHRRGIASRCMNPLHHLGPRLMSPSSSLPHRFHSFVVYLMKSAPGRLENAPSDCRPRNATIIGIKGASTDHCDRSRARKSADPKCRILPLSFTRWSRVVDFLQMRNLSSIWI